MPKLTFKNTSDQPLVIPNIGEVKAGGTIETDKEVNNPNLTLVKTAKDKNNGSSRTTS